MIVSGFVTIVSMADPSDYVLLCPEIMSGSVEASTVPNLCDFYHCSESE